MGALRHGFKSWSENTSLGYRREFGLEPHALLDPRKLAEHLGIMIWTPSTVPDLDDKTIHQLTKTDPTSWSAVTLKVGTNYLIIHNDTHHAGRTANTLAHEMAHIILKHPPAQVFISTEGLMMLNHYNQEHEGEAEYFAGALLVPRAALLEFLSAGKTEAFCEKHFGVSAELIRQRKYQTGIAKQLGYRQAKSG